MDLIDLRKDLTHLYTATAKKASLVKVPRLPMLVVDGKGDPNASAAFQNAIEALYGVAYTLKFGLKKRDVLDFTILPLEGLWWADNMNAFENGERDQWKWTLLVVMPGAITGAMVEHARREVSARKDMPALQLLRFTEFEEGACMQILHVGPYSDERPTIERLHAAIAEQGGTPSGKHHEIYLGDPRRAAPENLKTIIRQPFIKG
jgi:hypothetical protein